MNFKGGVVVSQKNYLRVTAGPCKWKYVHRMVAAALIGRELTKDEEVHHKDGDRQNANFDNLFVLGEKDHGWVSSMQAQFMVRREVAEKEAFDKFMAEQYAEQEKHANAAKSCGIAVYSPLDGSIRERWESQHAS